MKRFSQNNEDRIIVDYFGSEVGTFLDCGANDGITLSNTHACALRGWSGACVEPSPSAFARLAQLYKDNPNIEMHNVAMCTTSGIITLHESGEHLGNGDTALLSTIVPHELIRWESTSTTFDEVNVTCVTVRDLLNRSRFRTFDLISIDTEGLDLEILQQIDLTAVGCKMLVVEVNDRDTTPYVTYCAEHGMRSTTRTPENLIFIR